MIAVELGAFFGCAHLKRASLKPNSEKMPPMYQCGKPRMGSRLVAAAMATAVVVLLFCLVPLVNQMKWWGTAGESGLSVLTTAVSPSTEMNPELSISVRRDRIERVDRSEIPAGWTPTRTPIEKTPREIEMPVLENFELADKAETAFVFNVGDLDYTPTPIFRQRPDYPSSLRRQAKEGNVVAQFRVDREGRTSNVVIISSDHPEFSSSVIHALQRWRFLPGRVNGTAVEFRMRIPMVFRIVPANSDEGEPMFATAN